MSESLKSKIRESLSSILPVTLIVAILCFTITPLSTSAFMMFVIGAALLVIGMGLFTLGAETSMSIIGERIGEHLTGKKNLIFIILVCFIIGTIVTLAEPDLTILAEQIKSIPSSTFIWAVSIGVGIFLVIAVLRMLFKIKLSYILFILYGVIFLVTIAVPKDFLSIAFDAGGVTTGPITVPFLIAFGVGAVSARNDKDSNSDSFGLVALCSIGPILIVLLLGLLFGNLNATYTVVDMQDFATSKDVWYEFGNKFPIYIEKVFYAIMPVTILFFIYQTFVLKMSRKEVLKILVGLFFTFVGLVLFLTGVNVGFMPIGNNLGISIANLEYNWIIIPIAMSIGYFVVEAEPAVSILNKQVSNITDGAIPEKAMRVSLSIGVALSLGLSMFRVLYGIPVMCFLIPGYLIALILALVVPNIFTSIAFDAGGVASGSMTATFLLPFAIGASKAIGGNVLQDAFGLVAMVAMTPLITIEIMGLIYKIKSRTNIKIEEREDTNEIIDYEWGWKSAKNGNACDDTKEV